MKIIQKKINEFMFNENKISITPLDPVGDIYMLTDVAADIWLEVKKGYQFTEIIDNLSKCYDVSKEDLENDVIEFLKVLSQENIIELVL